LQNGIIVSFCEIWKRRNESHYDLIKEKEINHQFRLILKIIAGSIVSISYDDLSEQKGDENET